MQLTVTARIASGFGIIVIFLILIGISSFSSINRISGNLSKVVDEMAPIGLLGGELKSLLLEVNQHTNAYNNTRSLEALPEIKAKLDAAHTQYLKDSQSVQQLAKEHDEILPHLEKLTQLSDVYFSDMEKVFSEHTKELGYAATLTDLQDEIEDLADELDTVVTDFADDTSKKKLQKSLENISNLASEAIIITIDALGESNIEGIKISSKELNSITNSLRDLSQLVSTQSKTGTESGYYQKMLPLLEKYINLLSGQNSLLTIFQQQLQAKANALAQMKILNKEVEVFLNYSTNLIKVINASSDETKTIAEDNVSFTRIFIIITSLISIIVASGIAYWVIQSIRTPLNNVNNMLQVISEGDLSQHIDVTCKDEFGELSKWVNGLVDNLRIIIQNIQNNSQQLSTAAEETSVITNQTSSNINQQRLQTNQIQESMEQMSAAVEEIAQSANSASSEVEKAHSETTEGSAIVGSNISSIKDLAGEIDTAADVINKLDEYSNNIGNVLDVIRGIAEQTNLLALNAAIEAARAGEQGRGFAVVADEVRTLASRTQESTSEIQAMIERLQTGAKKAVAVMDSSRTKAASSVDDIQQTGELLQSITEGISVINDMSTHIATAAEEQASVTEEVHKNVNTIASIADQTAVGAEKTLSSCVEFARLSETLKASVSHFKI